MKYVVIRIGKVLIETDDWEEAMRVKNANSNDSIFDAEIYERATFE